MLGDALAGRATKTKAGEVTRLSQAFDAYLEWVKTNRPKAYKQRRSIKKVWIDVVGDVPIDRLGPELLERYKSKRQAAETAPATINKGMMVVKHMCGLAARSEWGWIDRERAAVIREVGMLEEPPGRQRPIKPKERDAIFAAFKRTDARFARRVIAAALLTGCRLGEILAMRVDDVDLRGKVIDLSKTKQNRNHQVVITPALASLLKEAMAEPGSKKSGVVFVNRFGKAYTVDGFSKHFARVADRAKCPDVTFHDLRRHVGTTLINAGERLEVVSKLLGHSNVAVTQRSYAHLTTEATRAAAERLSKALPVLPPIVASGLPSAADRRSRKRTKDATDAHEGGLS
ncbi:MAG TPA: site-specific integrase [Polyangiaceae bacterium]|nr:site-specific integrase [Polyangiaceae bacterium]